MKKMREDSECIDLLLHIFLIREHIYYFIAYHVLIMLLLLIIIITSIFGDTAESCEDFSRVLRRLRERWWLLIGRLNANNY